MVQECKRGQIVNRYSTKCCKKARTDTDDITNFETLKKVFILNKKQKNEYEIEEVKEHKNMVLIKFKGVDTIEQAELLRNSYIVISRKDTKELEEDRYYIVDLLGLEVFTDEGTLLGNVEDIYNTGSNDIYVVKNDLGKQILLPAISDVIKQIDIKNNKIIVHLIKGLI